MTVPAIRIRPLNAAPMRDDAGYVLYWMIAARRVTRSYALDRAVEYCRGLGLPLFVFEPLRAGYLHACDRFHRFVIDGMREHAEHAAKAGVTYAAYVEPSPGEGAGLLEALAARAAVVVTDDYPTFFLPRMVAAAAERLDVKVEAVDGNGLLPTRAPEREPVTARGYRRFYQGIVMDELARAPSLTPLDDPAARGASIPKLARWRFRTLDELAAPERWLGELPIDHRIAPTEERGGRAGGLKRWEAFLPKLDRYGEDGRHPDLETTSGISPWLHFGHVAAHELFDDIAERAGLDRTRPPKKPTGKRDGWWGVASGAEELLEQLVCWRELSYAVAEARPDHREWSALPRWAQDTLTEHASDERPYVYTEDELEEARTHDAVWNAAQRQLRGEGRVHNYLRMLWGKKILEWSPSPKEALERLVRLNDRWALDGRDPNSYSGISWTLGHLDRPWGPVRPIYGTVRYMSSDATIRKLKMKRYLERWGDA
ncbi:MAG: deoxyribodipyrimidine photolyase [Sandaracinaceae bacterium]